MKRVTASLIILDCCAQSEKVLFKRAEVLTGEGEALKIILFSPTEESV